MISLLWLIPICIFSVFVGMAIVAVCSVARDADYRDRIRELEGKLEQ